MLDGLDGVDWAGLRHAHGTATDVPAQLRALRSADPEARRQARWALHGNIFHQGLRFEATAPAVPFLLELLGDLGTPDRAELVDLLVTIAIGYSELWLPDGLSTEELSPGPARAAYDAVRAGVPLFRQLAGEPDDALRTAAAYALAWFPDDAAGSMPVLAKIAARTDAAGEGCAATALVALGLLGAAPPADALLDERPLVRLGAAIAAVRVAGHDVGRDAVDELLAWSRTMTYPDPRLPFLDGDTGAYAGLALRQVGPAHEEVTFAELLARIPRAAGGGALQIVTEALCLAFPEGPAPDGAPFASLDRRQRALVRALADAPATWQFDDGNLSRLVGYFRLPADNAALREYANLSAP